MNRTFALALALVLLLTSCARQQLSIDVNAKEMPADAALSMAIYADDGSGCEGLRFVAEPRLTLLAAVALPAGVLDVDLASNKVVVASANLDGRVVGRGCADVPGGAVAAAVIVRHTHQLQDVTDRTVEVALGVPAPGGDVRAEVITSDGRSAHALVAVTMMTSDGAVVTDYVDAVAGSVAYSPSRGASGPAQLQMHPENPMLDEQAVVVIFVAPFADQLPLPLTQLRPLLLGTEVHYVGVDDNGMLTALNPLTSVLMRWPELSDDVIILKSASSDTGAGVVVIDNGDLAWALLSGEVMRAPSGTQWGEVNVAAAGSCARADALPLIVIADDLSQWLVSEERGKLAMSIVDDPRFIFDSICVTTGSQRQRLLLASNIAATDGNSARIDVFNAGAGVTAVADIAAAAPVVIGLEHAVLGSVSPDGIVYVVESDAGDYIVRPLLLDGNRLINANLPIVRLPSIPVFMAAGRFFNNSSDLVALLELGNINQPNQSALFGIAHLGSEVLSAGIIAGPCAPAEACINSLAADADGDGYLEIWSASGSDALLVAFR